MYGVMAFEITSPSETEIDGPGAHPFLKLGFVLIQELDARDGLR
jgi:hypothetical protein